MMRDLKSKLAKLVHFKKYLPIKVTLLVLLIGIKVQSGLAPFSFLQTKDPHFDKVVLLIQPKAAAASIVDESLSPHSISTAGDSGLSTAVSDPWGGSRKVISFDGTGDYISAPDSNDWNYGTGDFTIELWAYFPSVNTSSRYTLVNQREGGSTFSSFSLNNLSNQGLDFWIITSGATIIDGGHVADSSASSGSWHHIALVRSGTTFTTYLNGVSESSLVDADSWPNNTGLLYIGGHSGGSYMNGYLGAIRITKGFARYTSGFTRPSRTFPSH